MINNYLKIAIRHLRRYKGYAFINIAGLAIGMACCVLMLLYVRNEISYDAHHEKGDQIYRLVSEHHSADEVSFYASNTVPTGPTLKQDIPEVLDVIRFWRGFRTVLGHDDNIFREANFYFTDPSVFEAFSFELIEGDPETALAHSGTIVLTESIARKYFGEEEALGKVLDYNGYPGTDSLTFTVTGILRDLPSTTHFAFDFLASLEGIETERTNFGSHKPIWTYVLLPKNTPPANLESKLPGFVDKYLHSETSRRILHLEPLRDIHLYSQYEGGFKTGSDATYLYLFAGLGFFTLLIACVNFINLATARSLNRTQEVGMRKVLGARREQLIGQFLGEALVQSTLALLFALVLLEGFLPVFNALFEQTLVLNYGHDPFLLLSLLGIVVFVGLLAGTYPAFFLSHFQPLATLKSTSITSAGTLLRKTLVVFQFSISVVLIIGTAVVYQQLDYLRQKNLGFDKEQVVVMPYSPNEEPLLAALEQHPNVLSASVSQRVPVNTYNTDGRPVIPEGFQERVGVDSYIIDDQFTETFGLELAAGRFLSGDRASDSEAFLINETAVKRFGWNSPEEALGKQINWTNGPTVGPVVGVVKDFHIDSMHEAITPLVLHMRPGEKWWRTFMSAKINSTDITGTLAFLEQTWRSLTPEGAYEYFFIDESFEQLHRADARFGWIFGTFAILAIVIACLGLFGLAAFTAEQRTKEIGVRKVLGASVPGVVLLLSKDFARLVLLALIVAAPIAYLSMNRWLDNFAYHTEVGVGTFVLAGVLALLIAVLTVSYQAIKAALANPIKALRYE